MKKYVPVKESAAATHLCIETYYSLGGMNYFTGAIENRGYYLSVSPVTKSRGMESFAAFSGIKKCIKPVPRKSAKAEAEAEKIAADFIPALVKYVCTYNGLEIDESEAI